MADVSPGTVLRQLQQAQAGMKKARKVMLLARDADAGPEVRRRALQAGWESLAQAHRLLAAIPLDAANEAVMTRQLAVQRYATSLLVRLRRLARNEPDALEGFDDEDDLE
jgi:hypothetical protein